MTDDARHVWVVGGIAWDTVLHVQQYPARGGYVRGYRRVERPGGSAGNVAQSLATAGLSVGFATTLGNDEFGRRLHAALQAGQLNDLHVSWADGDTEHVLVVVDDEGDRTIFGLSHRESGSGSLDGVPLRAGDIVVFVVWEEDFLDDLALAAAAGCTTIVGLRALFDPRVAHADVAFGSHADVPDGTDPRRHLDRFDRVVMTHGARGAIQHTREAEIHQAALPATVVDTTGAGDAFLAGYVTLYAHGHTNGIAALLAGALWAAAAVEVDASVPPSWRSVDGLEELLNHETHQTVPANPRRTPPKQAESWMTK